MSDDPFKMAEQTPLFSEDEYTETSNVEATPPEYMHRHPWHHEIGLYEIRSMIMTVTWFAFLIVVASTAYILLNLIVNHTWVKP